LAKPMTRTSLTPAASRVLTTILEPQFNHNGGALFFGTRPEDRNLLYITSGDGGCADDQNGQLGLAGEGPCISHEGPGNAQRLDNPLGKILRIDPLADGAPQIAPEIYAFGFRNPFRASSDRADLGGTGLIWTADVGQNDIEEVDARIVQGGNYGWRVKEGTFLFHKNGVELMGFASDGFVFANSPGRPPGLIDPVAQYDHDEGVATIGGFVYRGQRHPALRGKYMFGTTPTASTRATGACSTWTSPTGRTRTTGRPRCSTSSTGTSTCSSSGSARTPRVSCTCSRTRPAAPPRRRAWS